MGEGASHGYVIYKKSFRDNSFIIDFFTRSHGLVTVLGRGKKRRGVYDMSPFEMFVNSSIRWRGRGDLPTLTQIESVRRVRILKGRLLFGLYANELLKRLLEPHYEVEDVFVSYERFLLDLSREGDAWASLLVFELALLQSLGHDLLERLEDESLDTVSASRYFIYDIERGYCRVNASASKGCVSGRALGALYSARIQSRDLLELRSLVDHVIAQLPGGQRVHSRALLPALSNT